MEHRHSVEVWHDCEEAHDEADEADHERAGFDVGRGAHNAGAAEEEREGHDVDVERRLVFVERVEKVVELLEVNYCLREAQSQ